MSRFSLLFVFLFFLASSASAAIVNIEYTAHIYNTTGDGLGYQNGDSISGSYVIDTSKAEGKIIDNPTNVWYYGSLGSGLLQSNFGAPAVNGYVDFVRVNNDPGRNDQLLLDKVINVSGSIFEAVGINVNFNGLDWISDLMLNNINLISNEGGLSYGGFTRWNHDLTLNSFVMTDSANFWLDSITITSIATSVPEPAPLILLSIAMAGLIIRRRLI